MTVLVLTHELALKLTGDPQLYVRAPFLKPLEKTAMSVHRRLPRGGCRGCTKRFVARAARQLGDALVALLVAEASKPQNGLLLFKAAAGDILKSEFGEILVSYRDRDGKALELKI